MEDEMNFEEAAKVLGVTPARITQLANAGVLAVKAMGSNNPHDIGLSEMRLVSRKAVEEFAFRSKSATTTEDVPKGLHQ